MICPHCSIAIHDNFTTHDLKFCGENDQHQPYYWYAKTQECPSCMSPIIQLQNSLLISGRHFDNDCFIVYPITGYVRPPAPVEVPAAIAVDYNDAAKVLNISAQASAALSRRCLQHLLANSGLSKNSNLDRAISEAIDKGVPTHIADQLDAVRTIGNFAAHAQKSVNTGEILPVEPHEAEWTLDVLDMLFDHCYVLPAKIAAKRAALDAKLAEAGKPPLK